MKTKLEIFRPAIQSEIDRLGWTAYRLAKEADLSPDPVYKFLRGERGVTTATLEPIMRVLGMELTFKS